MNKQKKNSLRFAVNKQTRYSWDPTTNSEVRREGEKYLNTYNLFLGGNKQGFRNGTSNAIIDGIIIKTLFGVNPLIDKNKSNLSYQYFKSLTLFNFIHHDLFKNAYDYGF